MELSEDEPLSELSPVELPSVLSEPFVDVSEAVDPEVDEPEADVEDGPVDDSAPDAPEVACVVDEPVEPALDVVVERASEVLVSPGPVGSVLAPSVLEPEPLGFGLLSVV